MKSYCLHCRDQGIDNPATRMVGPYSLCDDHADDETIRRRQDRERRDRFYIENKEVLDAEARAEQEWEWKANQ